MNQLRFTYILMSWNICGLGQNDKCDAVHDAISVSRPHIVCLQESKLDSATMAKCQTFLPPYLSEFSAVPANNTMGGLITAWNPAVLKAGNLVPGAYTLSIPFYSTTSDYSFHLTNVYAPSNHGETDVFLVELSNLQPPLTVLGWL
jgi:exonuclease III